MQSEQAGTTERKAMHLFICGCPRSGTAAVARWLSSAPEIAIGVERYSAYWETHTAFPNHAFTKSRFFNYQPGDSWHNDLSCDSSYYQNLQDKWGCTTIQGDAIPMLWNNFSELFLQFPDARVIYTYRDPFSVARSCKSLNAKENIDNFWGVHSDPLFGVQEWNNSARSVVDFVRSYRSADALYERFFILPYEDFITECTDRSALMCFLGGTYHCGLVEQNRYGATAKRQEILSDTEKNVIWDILDLDTKKEMNRLMDNQRLHFLNKTSLVNRPGRTDFYHTEDQRLADINYGELKIVDCSIVFRGRVDSDLRSHYVACIGSATTFGRFVPEPFPAQLEKFLGIPVLNLGIGGARPESYLSSEGVLRILRGASVIIMEAMSARGYLSPFFEPLSAVQNVGYFKDFFNLTKYAHQDMRLNRLIEKANNSEPVFVDRVFEASHKYLSKPDKNLVREALLSRYMRDTRCLIECIGKPIIVLYMSRNEPFQARKIVNSETYEQWSGYYPHFIDEVFLDYTKKLGAVVVVSRSQRGVPFVVKNWKTGEPAPVFPWQPDPSLNTYYPSQEMHDDAAHALLQVPVLQQLPHS